MIDPDWSDDNSKLHRDLHIYAVNDAMLTLDLLKAQGLLRNRRMRNIFFQIVTFIAIESLIYALFGAYITLLCGGVMLIPWLKRAWSKRRA